ncbi:hypothetical protein ACFLXV_03715 [Chloroflexota bacterium]
MDNEDAVKEMCEEDEGEENHSPIFLTLALATLIDYTGSPRSINLIN